MDIKRMAGKRIEKAVSFAGMKREYSWTDTRGAVSKSAGYCT